MRARDEMAVAWLDGSEVGAAVLDAADLIAVAVDDGLEQLALSPEHNN